MTLDELNRLVDGRLEGDGSIIIESAAPIKFAQKGDISFIANVKYTKYLESTAASAVVLPLDMKFDRAPAIRHKNPQYAFALILDKLYPEKKPDKKYIDPTAVVSDSVEIGKATTVGAMAFIGDNSEVGTGSVIHPQVFIGKDVVIGNNCRIYPRVSILDGTRIGDNVIIHSGTVVGSDGFGYAPHETGLKKVKQIGWVEVADNVEIGANVTIDRGALGPTMVGRGTKIDNLVQIAHNVQIGENCIIVGQVGISGSTKLGNGVVLAGQVGVTGHIEIGDGVQVGAKSGVSRSIPAGKQYFGYPAREIMQTMRINASLNRLPELLKRVRKLEQE